MWSSGPHSRCLLASGKRVRGRRSWERRSATPATENVSSRQRATEPAAPGPTDSDGGHAASNAARESVGKPCGASLDDTSVRLNNDMTFSGTVAGTACCFLLDTGSSMSIINRSVYESLSGIPLHQTSTKAKTASQADLPLLGRISVPLQVASQTHVVNLYVSEAIDVPCILGLDFMSAVPCVIDLSGRRLVLVSGENVRTVSANCATVGSAVLGFDVSLPAGTECLVKGYVHNCGYEGDVIVEPSMDVSGVQVVRCVAKVREGAFPLLLRNVTTENICLPKHSQVADLEVSFVEEDLPPPGGQINSDVESLIDLSGSDITADQRCSLVDVLLKHASMFDGHVGHTDVVTHTIDTGDSPPVRQSPRRIPPHLTQQVRDELTRLVQEGILEESDSGWASPICLVRKKSGELRICADMRKLNAITRLPAYPIPRIDDTLDSLAGSSLYCVLDMNAAYHQISIDPEDRDKATITTPLGNFRYRRMCFGLSSAPFTCCKLLNAVLGDMPRESCVHYFDDIIVHGKTFDDVLTALDETLSRLSAAGLTLNLSKCEFFKPQVTFLGHVISRSGMSSDPEKVSKVRNWPEPRTKKELSSFLGLCSYFKKYVKDFAVIASPLFDLTRKDVPFQWSSRADEAFVKLKKALSDAPVVAFPRFGERAGEFVLDCDASNEGIGAVLLQEQDGEQRVISFSSHRLSRAQRNYSTTKKELLACVTFVQEFSHYLKGKRFFLRTDHSSLQWLINFRNPSGMLARWMEVLGDFQFQILYRPGAANSAADALSRYPPSVHDKCCQTETCSRISAPDWPMSFIQCEQRRDDTLSQVIHWLEAGKKPAHSSASDEVRRWLRQWSRLRLLEGVLFRVYRRRAGDPESLQVAIPPQLVGGVLTSLHAGPCGGHFGPEKLMKQTQLRFYWPGMQVDIEEFCGKCDRCAGRNAPNPQPRAPMGELHASEPWEMMSIDFLTDLPLTDRGNKHLLICCDHFTRWVEVFPLPDMSAVTVARTLADEVFSRFGCPKRLHSDCAANFKSQLIAELCRIMGVEKSNTTAFHPQGNSRCERVNRTVLNMLSKYLSDNHSEWDKHLPLLMLGYRAQVHRSVGYSPFYLMFGREPRLPVDSELDVPHVVRSKSAAEYIDDLCAGLRDAYREALKLSDVSHRRNKRRYDEKVSCHRYAVGDHVMVHRAAVKRGEYHKFRRPWLPAVVVAVKGELYYRVKLGDGKVLGVHHNKLKPHGGQASVLNADGGSERPDDSHQDMPPSSQLDISPGSGRGMAPEVVCMPFGASDEVFTRFNESEFVSNGTEAHSAGLSVDSGAQVGPGERVVNTHQEPVGPFDPDPAPESPQLSGESESASQAGPPDTEPASESHRLSGESESVSQADPPDPDPASDPASESAQLSGESEAAPHMQNSPVTLRRSGRTTKPPDRFVVRFFTESF